MKPTVQYFPNIWQKINHLTSPACLTRSSIASGLSRNKHFLKTYIIVLELLTEAFLVKLTNTYAVSTVVSLEPMEMRIWQLIMDKIRKEVENIGLHSSRSLSIINLFLLNIQGRFSSFIWSKEVWSINRSEKSQNIYCELGWVGLIAANFWGLI